MTKDVIEKLAAATGIASEYFDYKKDLTHISRQAQEYVLQTMGIATGTGDAEAALDELQAREWQQVLPPVIVSQFGQSIQVNLNLPAAQANSACTLSIATTADLAYEGDIDLASFVVTDSYNSAEAGEIVRKTLELNPNLPIGEYELAISAASPEVAASTRLMIAPQRCYEPPKIVSGGKVFGVTLSLYAVKSARNWGMGDFSDLKRFITDAAPHGVDLVGLNPLHALFPSNPHHFSPYAPTNRAFLNTLYIDAEAVPEFAESESARGHVASPEFQERLAALRATSHVDYPGVSACKMPVFELLFQHFRKAHLGKGTERDRQYQAFLEEQGDYLRLHATYDALHEHFFGKDMRLWGWPVWQEEFRSPDSPAVNKFIEDNRDRVEYYQYLQWLAFDQLRAAQRTAEEAGMAVGIYLDLAVGVDQAGSECWINRHLYRFKASVGAPPDALALGGQDWGFPPMDPQALRQDAYWVFARNLQASMSCAGAVRFDHAVALLRLWWIPRGHGANHGAFVYYPIEDITSILALESQRHNCLVIGEDLGTVPNELTTVMRQMHIYSYLVLYFEQQKRNGKPFPNAPFVPPADYPTCAVATVTTHDLPTLASWWDESDIELRIRLGMLPSEETIRGMREGRHNDKTRLLEALAENGLLAQVPALEDVPDLTDELNQAIHLFLATSGAAVMVFQMEDLLGMLDPINVPGTGDSQHANWKRKVQEPVTEYFDNPFVIDSCRRLKQARP